MFRMVCVRSVMKQHIVCVCVFSNEAAYCVCARACACERVCVCAPAHSVTKWRVCVCVALLEELVNSGRVLGSIVGGRQDKAVFVPDVYCRAQNAWVESFLTHNAYLGNSQG